jgi:hypothetical protein
MMKNDWRIAFDCDTSPATVKFSDLSLSPIFLAPPDGYYGFSRTIIKRKCKMHCYVHIFQ